MSVKQKKRGRPTKNSAPLSQESIISTAKLLMENDGKIPSIRKLALNLDVDAMAIYHYFKNKDALLEAITTSLVEEIYRPNNEKEWKQELESLCVSYLELLQRYSGLLETLLSMTSFGPAEVFTDRFNRIVAPLALTPPLQTTALHLLADYLHGFALAMKCNQTSNSLEINTLKSSLALYCTIME